MPHDNEIQAYAYRRDLVPPIALAPSAAPVPAPAPASARSYRWFSLHDHIVRMPAVMEASEWARYRAWDREFLGHQGLRESGLNAVFHSILDDADLTAVIRWAALLRADIVHHPDLVLVERMSDLTRAWDSGHIALLLGMEGAGAVGADLDNVELLYGLGVRSMGLTYNHHNALGCGLADPEDTGLTPFGRDAVRVMNDLGMLVDIAHVGDRTALDAMEVSTRPVVISHAGARTLWPTRRMKPDAVIRACSETGGVIGIEAAPTTTQTLAQPRHTLETVMAHFEYCVELVGMDHVAFGPDTVFGDHVGLHQFDPVPPMEVPPYEAIPYVEGAENPRETFSNIEQWLIAHGYSVEDRAKVLGGNVERVLRQVLVP